MRETAPFCVLYHRYPNGYIAAGCGPAKSAVRYISHTGDIHLRERFAQSERSRVRCTHGARPVHQVSPDVMVGGMDFIAPQSPSQENAGGYTHRSTPRRTARG